MSDTTKQTKPADSSSSFLPYTYLLGFFLSGAAGLIYQIVWIRILSIVFGNTTYAVSMVVAGFLSGLALGSRFWGGRADSFKNPLKEYLKLEVYIALSAVVATVLIYMVDDFIVSSITVDSIDSFGWQIARYIIIFLLLLAPTSFMGGTAPLMGKVFVRSFENLARGVGSVYAVNTYGGVAGCLMAGFLLVPFAGVKAAFAIAVLFNVAVACIFWIAMKSFAVEKADEKNLKSVPKQKHNKKSKHKGKTVKEKESSGESAASLNVSTSFLLVLYAVSGFCALGFEVLWTRAFIVSFKSTVYLFSNLLAVFLLGMALGSHLFSKKGDRLKNPMKLFGISQVGIGLFGILSIFFFLYSADIAFSIGSLLGGMSWAKDMVVMFLLMLSVFLLPTALMGLSYPLISRMATGSLASMGKSLGTIYAVGTVGGIAGSLMAGFFILPLIGLQAGLIFFSVISLICGYVALANSALLGKTGWAIPATAIFAVAVFVALQIGGIDIGIGGKSSGKLVFVKEGVMGTVKVSENVKGGPLTLMVNNYQLATSGDVAVRFGHIPLLIRDKTDDVLLISLGSGITAGSIGAHDTVERIDCVEIVPTLLDVQPLFKKDNRNIVADKRFNISFWDGRHYVRATKRKYDLVVSDLFQPDSAGVGSLYALEHFQNVKKILKTGGSMAQWLPLYQLSPDNLKVIMRTFAYAFEHVAVWSGDINSELPALMLLGSSDPIQINPAELAKKFELEAVKVDMVEHSDPLSFLSFYVMDREAVLKYTKGFPINTDDRPIVEYTAPQTVWNRKQNSISNFASLISSRQKVTALLPLAGRDKALSDSIDRYYEGRTKILKAKVEHAMRNYPKELELYKEAAKSAPSDPYLSMALFDLGFMYYKRRDYRSSSDIFQWSKKINPNLLEAYFYLAKSYERLGMKKEALEELSKLAQLRPDLASKLLVGK